MSREAIISKSLPQPKSADRSDWVGPYTICVSALGLLIGITALFHLPEDLPGLILFAALAAIAELGGVDLYLSSRSRISVSSFVAIAGVLVFGPLSGALIVIAAGLMTLVSTALFSRIPKSGQVSWLRRSAFNAGMYAIAAFFAGQVFIHLGRSPLGLAKLFSLLPLILTTTVFNLINLILLISVISLQTGQRPLHIWKQDFQWAVPIAVAGGVLGGGALALAYEMFADLGLAVFFLPILATSYSHRLYVQKTQENVSKLERLNEELETANHDLENANLSLENNNLELLQTLASIIDADDRYTAYHSRQVARYAQALAEQMGLRKDEVGRLYKAALLHDIGKVGVMDSIIGQQGRLDDEQYNLVKRHPTIGANIVGCMTGFQELVPIIKHHHERWDGRGYPDGLKGEEIQLEARILSLADSIEAMLSDRPYRKTMSLREAREEVERCTGTQFDPQVVSAFSAVMEEKGPDFFKNSAALADEPLGVSRPAARYLKKSMID
jgi:putative nucleotidyltransferase with HDIG domain